MRIENDETIIAFSPIVIRSGERPNRIVLRYIKESYHPYVTHCESMRCEVGDIWKHEDFFWGHYFSTLEEAQKDFEERTKHHV
jgi:hypothetical protein